MELFTDKITGFERLSPVIIYDAKGVIFYASNNSHLFNLPKGFVGTVKGEIKPLREPINYYIPDLPPFEKKTPLKSLKITFGDNPNKCSVRFRDGVIFFDNQFKHKELARNYIIGHEIGHFFYIGNGDESEKNCDIFSAKMMLENGYNPSQIIVTSEISLTGQNKEYRINALREYLEKVYITNY